MPEPVLDALCARCAREGAEGLRADLTIHKAAAALAAYEGRTTVTEADVEAVAELALAHRRTRPPQGPPPSSPPPSNDRDRDAPNEPNRPQMPRQQYFASGDRPDQGRAEAAPEPGDGGGSDEGETRVLPAADPAALASWSPRVSPPRKQAPAGRRGRLAATDRRGAFIGAAVPRGRTTDPALAATLRAAAPWQSSRGWSAGAPLIVRPDDLREKVRARPSRHLVLFVVDASRSMGARERMRQTKAAVLSLLVDAYQKRDRVGLITFGKGGLGWSCRRPVACRSPPGTWPSFPSAARPRWPRGYVWRVAGDRRPRGVGSRGSRPWSSC